MDIVIVSQNYPSQYHPQRGAFVYNLVQELANHHNVTVIAPLKIFSIFGKKHAGYGLEKCTVYRPLYFTFGKKRILGVNLFNIGINVLKSVVQRCFKKNIKHADLIYTHFLINGLTIADLARDKNIPLVIASGESTYPKSLPVKAINKMLAHTAFVICVSDKNYKSILTLYKYDSTRMQVVPNAVDYETFRPSDKTVAKQNLHIDPRKFVVGFIGHFIERKGPNRVIEAIARLNDPDIVLVCVGDGGSISEKPFVKIIKPLPNPELPAIINAFDVFVLPTLNEGHCNVVEEAKACCVPVISSLNTTVEKQIDASTGILVDPTDIEAIADAILLLKNDESKRMDMVRNLKLKIGEYSLQQRAAKISDILVDVIARKN